MKNQFEKIGAPEPLKPGMKTHKMFQEMISRIDQPTKSGDQKASDQDLFGSRKPKTKKKPIINNPTAPKSSDVETPTNWAQDWEHKTAVAEDKVHHINPAAGIDDGQ